MQMHADPDLDAVRAVQTAAFADDGRVAGLVADLAADPATLSVAAVEDGVVAGHVMASRCLLDAPDRLVEVATLSPLGVLPAYQRRGIGRALIERITELADAAGWPLLFLEGDPAYYRDSGFVAAGGLGFRKPSLRIPDAAFQVRTLSGYEPSMTGTLVYSAVFWEHDCVGLRG